MVFYPLGWCSSFVCWYWWLVVFWYSYELVRLSFSLGISVCFSLSCYSWRFCSMKVVVLCPFLHFGFHSVIAGRILRLRLGVLTILLYITSSWILSRISVGFNSISCSFSFYCLFSVFVSYCYGFSSFCYSSFLGVFTFCSVYCMNNSLVWACFCS